MLLAKPLGKIAGTNAEEIAADAMAAFSCQDKDVENFLRSKAFDFERRNKSRTYLIIDQEQYCGGDFVLVAYFTLSHKFLELQRTLSPRKIKEIDGFKADALGVVVPLIGQFGKDEAKGKPYTGKEILNVCMKVVYQIQELAGGRHVLIECHDTKKVVDFYTSNAFYLLQADKEDKYWQMVRKL